MNVVKHNLAEYLKGIAALVGAAATAFTLLIPADWGPWVTAITSFFTAAAVYLVPNAPTPEQRARVVDEYVGRHAAPEIT